MLEDTSPPHGGGAVKFFSGLQARRVTQPRVVHNGWRGILSSKLVDLRRIALVHWRTLST